MNSVSSETVKELGNILGVWAHPDDESFTSAGLMAIAVRNGQKVACITATKGEQGLMDEKKWPPNNMGEVRARELGKTLDILGVSEHHWLGYPDGGCEKVDQTEAVKCITSLINDIKPDTIITFPPYGITGHPDHKAVSSWALVAAKASKSNPKILFVVDTREQYQKYIKVVDAKFDIYFAIDQPILIPEKKCSVVLRLPADILELKRRALAAQPSQTEAMYEAFDEDFWLRALSTEAFVELRPNTTPIK